MKNLFIILITLSLFPLSWGQYQLANPGFENWDGTSQTAEPAHWNSFASSDGSYASMASSPHHYHRHGGRPGTSGNSFVTLWTKSILGIKANGNMTTGRIHAGSMSAANAQNYNYTKRSDSEFRQPFSGTPDSVYIWVSYYAANSSDKASISIYLHGDNDFRDPNDNATTSLYAGKAVMQFTRTSSSASSYQWQQKQAALQYDGTTDVRYALVSLTTNMTPGGGSANDSLSVDDIEFIYSAWLDSLSLYGHPLDGFELGQLDYYDSVASVDLLSQPQLNWHTQASDSWVAIDTTWLAPNQVRYVLHVWAEDSLTTHTYSITLTAPEEIIITECPEPSSLTANSLDLTQAWLSWTIDEGDPVADSMTFQFVVEHQGTTLIDTMVTACSQISIQGLETSSTYFAKVRTLCDTSNMSNWSHCTFVTLDDTNTQSIVALDAMRSQIYPNPATDQIVINSAFTAPVTAHLYDATGRTIDTFVLTSPCHTYTVSHFPQGTYYLSVGQDRHRFIKITNGQ